jgi:hypothetical protein
LLSVRVFEARSLIVQTGAAAGDASRPGAGAGAGVRVRIRRESDGTRWTFDAPITAKASKTAVELAINELNALHAKSFPASAPSSPSSAPMLRVTLDGNGRQETLFIGEPVRAAAPPNTGAAPAEVEYYAQLEGRAALFTVVVPTRLLNTLRNALETLREKRILEFEPAGVTAVTLAAPVQPNQPPLTLQRLEPAAGQTGNVAPPWQIVRRGDGNAATPQTQPADRAAVQRLLERLALLTADVFKSDAPTSADLEEWGFNRPVREITLNAAGTTTPLIVRLGTDASRNVYARIGAATDNSSPVYQVAADILNDLPLAPIAWRDRAVAEPLPPNARIAAVKLTDLESKKVLFETAFNATGEASTPPRDPKALQTLIAGLRALRAKEFVGGGFAVKVTAAGDDRPWRFQLETAIALPAAGPGEQTSTLTIFVTERLGGAQQYAGIKELNTVFALEQPMVDALWALAYGPRDPGAPPDRKE